MLMWFLSSCLYRATSKSWSFITTIYYYYVYYYNLPKIRSPEILTSSQTRLETCVTMQVQDNDSAAVADDDDDDDDDNDDSRNCLACQQCPQDAPQTLASPQTPGLWPDMLLA